MSLEKRLKTLYGKTIIAQEAGSRHFSISYPGKGLKLTKNKIVIFFKIPGENAIREDFHLDKNELSKVKTLLSKNGLQEVDAGDWKYIELRLKLEKANGYDPDKPLQKNTAKFYTHYSISDDEKFKILKISVKSREKGSAIWRIKYSNATDRAKIKQVLKNSPLTEIPKGDWKIVKASLEARELFNSDCNKYLSISYNSDFDGKEHKAHIHYDTGKNKTKTVIEYKTRADIGKIFFYFAEQDLHFNEKKLLTHNQEEHAQVNTSITQIIEGIKKSKTGKGNMKPDGGKIFY